jgi:hypothetical protein
MRMRKVVLTFLVTSNHFSPTLYAAFFMFYYIIIGIRQGDDVSRLESGMDNQPLKIENDQEDAVQVGIDPHGGMWLVGTAVTFVLGCFYHEVFMLAALCGVMTLVEFFGSSRHQSP